MQRIPLRLKTLKPKDYAEHPQTIGEHIRKRRLELGLTQRQAAKLFGVDPFTVLNWEKRRTEPRVIDGKRVIAFLGYDPFASPTTTAELLAHERRKQGWSIDQAARSVGVDPGTWRKWENGGPIRNRTHLAAITKLLGLVKHGSAR